MATTITIDGVDYSIPTPGNQSWGAYLTEYLIALGNAQAAFKLRDWVAPSLLNGWVNYGGVYQDAGYYKDPLGMVHLRGLVKDGTATAGTTLFTLPVGFRPLAQTVLITLTNSVLGALNIETDGDVNVGGGTSSAWFSLENITFDTR